MALSPPDELKLYEHGLRHLARYPATEASLSRVLVRGLDRWGRLAAAEGQDQAELHAAIATAKATIPGVIARLRTEGLVNDASFGASRAKRLRREGKSRRYALAHLAAKGVPAAAAQQILPEDPERELAAACAYLRRRRAGPFGDAPELKALAAMGRLGFSQATARRALGLARDEAEDLIKKLHDPAA